MKSLIAYPCLLALFACEDRAELAVEAAPDLDQTQAEPTPPSEKEDRDQQVVTPISQPIGKFVTEKGEQEFGPLTVEVLEEDGKLLCKSTRHFRDYGVASGSSSPRWSTSLSSKLDFPGGMKGDWFVYVHTNREIWMYGGRGWLCRGTLEVKPDGSFASDASWESIGDKWKPSAELLQRMPRPVVERIEEIVKRGG